MSVDANTVRRVARLACLAVNDAEVDRLQGELNKILAFVECLDELNVDGVEPLTSVVPAALPRRKDEVTDGAIQADVLANAPLKDDGFFLVPKVVE